MTAKKPHPTRNFILVWLASSLLCVGYPFLYDLLNGTPHWLDVLILCAWIMWVSRWLAPLAARLEHWRPTRWIAIAIFLMYLGVALSWTLNTYTTMSMGLWRLDGSNSLYLNLEDPAFGNLLSTILWIPQVINHQASFLQRIYRQNTATLLTHFQVVKLALILGFGLTISSLSWRITWQPVLDISINARRRYPRIWRWLQRGLAWGLVLLLALDGMGILLTARPVPVEWEPIITTGFPSGSVYPVNVLAVEPDEQSLFAGTGGGGVFRSIDGGQTWQPVNQGLTDPNVWAFTVGPDGQSLFTGTFGGGVFHFDNEEQTWQSVNQGLTSLHVFALIMGPDGQSLFVGTNDGGVFRSDNGGQTWHPVNEGLTNLTVRVLIVGPDGQSFFAGTFGGVFRSDDRGQTWQPVNQGLSNPNVWSLAVGPDGQSLFVGTFGGGVFCSNDGGQTWQPVNQGLTTPDVWTLTVGLDGQSLFAGTWGGGVFRSDDRGQTWQPVNQGLTDLDVRALTVGPDGQSLFAGTGDNGMFHSDDGAQTWQPVNQGLTDLDVLALTVGPDGQNLFAGTGGGGLFRSDDEGRIWQPVNQGLPNLDVRAITVGLDGQSLFAGTFGGGVFRSDDGGRTWQPVDQGLTDLDVHALTVMPDGQSLFAGTWGSGVFRSNDRGQTWQPINEGLTNLNMHALMIGPDGQSLFAGTWGSGVFRSDDEGWTWQSINQGLTDLDVRALTVGPDGQSLFAGTDGGGVFHSDDGGRTWQPVNQGLTFLNVLAFTVGLDGQSLFAGTFGGGVFRSDDGGRTWQPVNQGLTILNVLALTVGSNGQSLFAGTEGGGVFRSDDGGQTWQPVNQGLIDLNVLTLTVMPDDQSLFAGTEGGGVFRSDDEGRTWQAIPATSAEFETTSSPPRIESLRWTTHQRPQAIAIHGNRATLYTSAGAAMILRDEIPLPLLWRAPTPYLTMIAATWRTFAWVAANAVPLSVSLGLAMTLALFYIYTGIVRPNRLRPTTVLWLLPRPRHPVAAAAYRTYAGRWAAGNPLERLILLQAPTEKSFTPAELEAKLGQLGAAFDAGSLQTALATLHQRVLLAREPGPENGDSNWRLTDPLLAQVQRRELAGDEPAHLAEQTRREHPLYATIRRFFEHAGFQTAPLPNTLVHRCEPDAPAWQRLLDGAIYVQPAAVEPLTGDHVRDIRDDMHNLDPSASTVVVVTTQRPTDQGWAQIGTFQMEAFTVLPVEHTLLTTGLADGREQALLYAEIEKRLGADYDPYDVRDPVAGAFSFFGRDALVHDLLRRAAEGRPVGIFGLRKMGKSSLLRALGDRAPFPVAAVNLQTVGPADVAELYTRALQPWLQWMRARGLADLPLPTIAPENPTASFVAAAQALLEHLHTHGQEPRLGLFLDEAELITPRPDGSGPDLGRYLAFIRAVRGLIDQDARLSLVVASLNPAINRINAWDGEQNPAFNLFQEIYLPPLARDDCIQLVRNVGRQVGLVYDDPALEQITALSGGHPFLARQLCSLLYRQQGRQPGQIRAAALPAAIERFLYDRQTITHLDDGIWLDAGNPALWGQAQATINQALLLQLAQADDPLPTATLLDAPDAGLRRTALIDLERFHFVHQPRPGEYALCYGLLRTWLRRRKLGLE